MKNEKWLVLNAENKILGRFASFVAKILIGKTSVDYQANKLSINNVIVINSEKIIVTGKKLQQKTYYKHSGYPGGLKKVILKDILIKNANFVIRNAVKGMLPKNKLQKKLLKKLKIYTKSDHKHLAQKPKFLNI